jgi:hypothetical protein
MTQPPPGWPSGDPQHGGWQPPPPAGGTGGWPPPQPQPPHPQPAGWPAGPQQPTPDQSTANAPQPGWGPPTGSWEPLGPQGGYPQPRSRVRGKLLASAAVVVALAAGSVATYIAVSDRNSNGAASPQQAVRSVVSDLNNSDLIGVLDDLAPGERDALVNPALDEINQLKRLKVLQRNANPSNVSGVTLHVQGLTFTDKTVKINDHVQIVQLTGGTLQVAADTAKVPFTRDFLDAAFPGGLPTQSNGATRIDIAEVVRENRGNRPIRIAAQRVGGKWYPSLFYTIADSAAQGRAPASSDAIEAAGGSSPKDAVTRLVNALLRGDVRGAVKLLSPDELGVLHDYGGLFLRDGARVGQSGVTLKDLQVRTRSVSGLATRVMLSSVTVANGAGDETTVKIDGNCVDVAADGQDKRTCASGVATEVIDALERFGVQVDSSSAQRAAFADLLVGLTSVGVDTTRSGGLWYVNPVRSSLEVTTSVLSGLKNNDLLELFGFFVDLGH